MTDKTALAIRHVAFEDIGSFESVLRERGYEVRYVEAGIDDVGAIDPLCMTTAKMVDHTDGSTKVKC